MAQCRICKENFYMHSNICDDCFEDETLKEICKPKDESNAGGNAGYSEGAPQPGAVAEGLQEKLTTKKYYKDGWEDAIKVVLFALSEFEIYEDSEIYQQIKCLKS